MYITIGWLIDERHLALLPDGTILRISHMPQVGFELADNLPLSYFESRFSVVIATTPRSHLLNKVQK